MKPRITDRVGYILTLCRSKRVLHLGCADAPFTQAKLADGTLIHGLIHKVATALYGIDMSRESVEILKQNGYDNVAVANVEQMETGNPFEHVDFDIIAAGEILEHLSNPGLFLESIKPILKNPSSRLLLTTVNAYCAHRFLHTLLTGRERVHPDHVYYFSRSTLTRLLTVHGYEIEEFTCYSGQEYEKTLNQGPSRILWWVDRLVCRVHPALGEGIIVVCKLAGLPAAASVQ